MELSAAMHTVTVTCEYCHEGIQCPVILTAGRPVRSPADGRLIVPVNVRTDTDAVEAHVCPDNPDDGPVWAIPRPRADHHDREGAAA